MELSREERNALSGAATRLRAASRWLDSACEWAAVPRAPEFEDWPFSRRSAAAARAAESDQAEDERLRAGVDGGKARGRRPQGSPLAARETEPPLHNVRRGAPRAVSHP
jgi:hypothetical protein